MANIEVVVIDAKTDINQFRQDLRWGEVYYGLSQGFARV